MSLIQHVFVYLHVYLYFFEYPDLPTGISFKPVSFDVVNHDDRHNADSQIMQTNHYKSVHNNTIYR